jgi:hypothetical protein
VGRPFRSILKPTRSLRWLRLQAKNSALSAVSLNADEPAKTGETGDVALSPLTIGRPISQCGPDFYIKHFITEVSGRPFLTLQFDGHNNDAGMLTRCEAYLDSKGVLRRWGSTEQEMPMGASNP